MAIISDYLGGTDNVDGDDLTAADVIDTTKEASIFAAPIGSILPWLKSYTNTPALPEVWVECNGQVLSDAESVYDGQTIPDLNGGGRFLYGAATSGLTKTEDFLPNHDHSYDAATTLPYENIYSTWNGATQTHSGIIHTKTDGTAWLAYSVVWVMRIK